VELEPVEYTAGRHPSSLGCEVRGCEVWRGGLHALELLLRTAELLTEFLVLLLEFIGTDQSAANRLAFLATESDGLILTLPSEKFETVPSEHNSPRAEGRGMRR
jgi:hypothetical protein